MRKVHLSNIVPGMELGKTVYSSSGQVLLMEGMILNEKFIKRLADLGVLAVFIKDGLTDDVPVPDLIDDKTRVETQQAVKEVFSSFEKGRSFDLSNISSHVNRIMDELLASNEILFDLTDIRTFDDYTFQHSVNVCILALITGISLGYNQLQLRDLGIGALLHDMGRIKISKDILFKPGALTEAEYASVQKHCTLGFEVLRKYENINLISAHVAFQHHEKFDGTGYPRGLTGEQIHEYARIVTYCDVYDALTTDRPYRKAYQPKEALKIIKDSIGSVFDPKIASAFFRNVVIFPVGSIVQLNSGEVGVIVHNNKEFINQPIVRIIIDKNHQRLEQPVDINLVENRALQIKRILNDSDPLVPSITKLQERIECI